ncbi:alpha/beta hydrolase family protein [Jeotgalibacillus salarius]|uniref:S9 family peptidase n=1 Tax=Jeotgalibacillus salarius TaxID=546023 RepID=A0A4Y8L6R5_9BACL|nr:prolyl oligopeptidase family serine peptidase [Jeotgalibacillus salarius]TFD98283.1 S9 family peptidase [Jeotgalibacillus salarius]
MHEVLYWSEGLKVKGLLAEPVKKGSYDGFLYLRGGIKGIGMVRPSRIAQFAAQGFIVFAPYYRGNRGGEGNEDFAGDDRMDAVNGNIILRRHSSFSGHLHVFGFSRGGVMALLVGMEDPGTSSVVTWNGVSDMVLTYEERKDMRRMMKRVIGGSPTKVPDSYAWRTPLNEIEKMNCPVLIIHGERDEHVSAEHAYQLERKLKEHQKPVESWYYASYDHVFPPLENIATVKRLTDWMKKQRS